MADNISTPVADGKILGAKEIGGVLYPWNLLADAGGADAMGLVVASPAAYTLLGRLKAITDGVTGATPAGENYTGKLGGDILTAAAVAPAVSTTAYATGNVVGGLLTFTGAARTAGGAGLIQAATVMSKSAQTAALDLLIFAANPTATTFADKGTVSINAADTDKLLGVIHMTDWTALGAASVAQAIAPGLPFKLPAGTALYGVLVARATMTLASASDLTPSLRIIPG